MLYDNSYFILFSRFVDLINDFSETIYFIIITLGLFLVVFNFLYVSYAFKTNIFYIIAQYYFVVIGTNCSL